MFRPSFKIDTEAPGSDLAGEAAAAMAAGSMGFRDKGKPNKNMREFGIKIRIFDHLVDHSQGWEKIKILTVCMV